MSELLSAKEVAELLDCSVEQVEEATRRKRLPAVKYGRSWRYPRQALVMSLCDEAMLNLRHEMPEPTRPAVVPVPLKPRRAEPPKLT